ncbi:MAG: thermonuclease family protein [Desulfobacterales bacterium]|nr:thermonuclease family protein [Desulfobacterales bacterium]
MRLKFFIVPLLILLLFISPALAGSISYGNAHVSRVRSVYDGDTFRCDIDGWPPVAGVNISVRISGIDTPEKRGSSDRVKKLARAARDLTVRELGRAGEVELRNIRRGKYFRLLAEVYVDGRSLADILIGSGLAKVYDGGTKPAW